MQSIIKTNEIDQETSRLVNYLKQHYEHICKLCALNNIPYLPSITNPTGPTSRLTSQIESLESALTHIKTQIRHVIATSDKKTSSAVQITRYPELCDSLSNYRRDVETLFHQLQCLQCYQE